MKKKKGNPNKKLLILIGIVFVIDIVTAFFVFKPQFIAFLLKKNLSRQQQSQQTGANDPLLEEINPSKGVALKVKYGNLGPEMLASGVIDLEKFKQIYTQGGDPLTQEQLDILTKGSDQEIVITPENSHFLLNFFWAAGLANKTKILTEGAMVKNGNTANFASTGGWTIAKQDAMTYYAKQILIPLTPQQEDLVNRVASNIYRPCCDNPTSFPDCNHGMAMLGVLELMASQGATEQQMYSLAKYVNSYWFPGTYYDLAQYFKAKEGKNFKDIDANIILGRNYSSASGYVAVKDWLTKKGIVKEPPQKGRSCGA